MSEGKMHFWTGSEIACGTRNPENSTESPSHVYCKRCLPAARKYENAMYMEIDRDELKHAVRRISGFLREWKAPGRNYIIYGLHHGDEREQNLTTVDLEKLIKFYEKNK